MSINKVILVGNVGGDPEVRHLDENSAVANFSLATTERAFKTRDGREIPEKTEWHRIVAWRGLAKIAESYIRKGTQLYIEGKLQTRQYTTKEGQERYTTEIVADTIQLLGRKADNPGSAGAPLQTPQSQQPITNAPQQFSNAPQQPPQQNPVQPNVDTAFQSSDDVEDDLPF